MAAPRKTRGREAQLAFDALSIEGGLLAPEWLAKVAQLGAGQQSETDYRVLKGQNLRDEIGRYWRTAQAYWAEFAPGLARGAKVDATELSARFVVGLLRDAFGFGSLGDTEPKVVAERSYPIGREALGGRVPVVIAPADFGLDAPSARFGEGGRRRTAFGLCQDYLNATDSALWGLVTDGVTLRVLRDNASLTRPAWIEADLRRIFTEVRYADFAALWLLIHETRLGRGDAAPSECALEAWRNAGREQGTRAREHLRRGVEEALLALGQGFLSHADNGALRAALVDGSLSTTAYFQQLLRLVYRLIFLLTVEERELLHPPDTSKEALTLYADGYSLRRLRERSVRRSAHDRFSDLWDAVRVAFRGLVAGEPQLGLPALSGLFGSGQCADIDAAKLENRALLVAMFKLSWLREPSGLSRVNWRDMGPEELGSVYESLLELVPQLSDGARKFAFATGDETKGNARKTSGSYYTPDSLVQVLLDSALEPVVKDTLAANPGKPVEALLKLAIVDPACGSGHFLLAAARRLAAHVARLQSNGTPSKTAYQKALRQVVGHCIYGVDLNPMAVELCKVSLWMEAVEPGTPLTFLDAHIQHGNALLGTTPELMAKGIPEAAWDPIEGDDKAVAKALKARNKQGNQVGLFGAAALAKDEAPDAVFEAEDDGTLDGLAKKEVAFTKWVAESADARFLADVWCAAFVWPKQPGDAELAAPVRGLWATIRGNPSKAPEPTRRITTELAEQYHFFHWHLAFPEVFKRGGFDVVLGNPPWERVKLQEQEFFASRSEEIAKAANASVRKKLIAALPSTDPTLWTDWCAASREAEGQSHLIRNGGRYPLCGGGDINTYALFAEHNRTVLGPQGRAGFIVPTGIATDDSTKEYFGALVADQQLAAFYSFENEEFIFPTVHHAVKFALLTVARSTRTVAADLLFFARRVSALADQECHFSLSAADFAVLNPNTLTCPTCRCKRDADISLSTYRRSGVLWREGAAGGNLWGLRFMAMFHMAGDSGLFRSRAELEKSGQSLVSGAFCGAEGSYLPLVEAKMIHQFDHRFGTYEAQSGGGANQGKLPEFDDAAHADANRGTLPDCWVHESHVQARLDGRWQRRWLIGWRNICRSTDQRTVIATLIPRSAVGHATPLMFPEREPTQIAALYANMCSFALDYAARQKVGGANLTYGYLKQLPVLPPSTYGAPAPWHPATTLLDFILPRVLELTYTAWDLEPFAQDVGYDGPPFRWDPARRFVLRAELDAAFFHLYGLDRGDTDYILDTFPIVRKNDEKTHGEYRTKRVILEVYDAMAEATRTGVPYVTRLDPPPADPRVAHPARAGVTA